MAKLKATVVAMHWKLRPVRIDNQETQSKRIVV
jgi:hypothetical protein